MAHLALVGLLASASALDGDHCTKYKAEGYCTHSSYVGYMKRHCSSVCDFSEGDAASMNKDDDPSCAKWKESGYCTHDQYAEYMQRSCPMACGLTPPDAPPEEGDASNFVAEFDETGIAQVSGQPDEKAGVEDNPMCPKWAEQGMCETFADYMAIHCAPHCKTATAATPTTTDEDSTPAESTESGPAPAEHENCAAWVKQGLCVGEYAEYMGQNCASSCASGGSGGAAAASTTADNENCIGWAKQGLCEGSAYSEYMALNCVQACAAAATGEVSSTAYSSENEPTPERCQNWARQRMCTGNYQEFMELNCGEACAIADQLIAEELPPPASPVVFLLVIGFGTLFFYAGKEALSRDAKRSTQSKRTLGIDDSIGSGKPNFFKSSKKIKDKHADFSQQGRNVDDRHMKSKRAERKATRVN